MAGGYQITFGYGDCTLGFPTLRGNTAGMVTAGHCTEPLPYNGGVASVNQVHQPNSSAVANLIGHEDLDPTFSTSTGNCGDSDGCRYSDATFVDFTSGTQYTLGRIAKPTSDWTTTVDPDSSHYDVVSDTTYANSGDQVFKVGRTTGQTRGTVGDTCEDKDDGSNTKWIGTILCQTDVGVSANGGDSESPVFKIDSGTNVDLVGILSLRSPVHYTFSPLGNIFLDLGPNVSWSNCASGYSC